MRKWVVLGIFLLILFGIFYYLTFGYYSEGKRGGFVVKLSKKGYVFKTYEGVLNVGGLYEGGGTLNATQWEFSVDGSDKEPIAKIEEAIKTGSRVSLTYEEKFFVLPWVGDTKNLVTNVEILALPSLPQNPVYEQPTQPQPAPLPIPEPMDSTTVL